jgi:hypothetical protein
VAKGVQISPAIGRVTFDDAATDLENECLANGRRSIVGLRVRIKRGSRPWFAGRRMVNIKLFTPHCRHHTTGALHTVLFGTTEDDEQRTRRPIQF